MKRINKNVPFLMELARAKRTRGKRLLVTASEEEIKSIAECIINLSLFQLSHKEKLERKTFKPLLLILKSTSKHSLKTIKAVLAQNIELVSKLLSIVLLKLSEEAVTSVLLQ
jgi:hypothetical protein